MYFNLHRMVVLSLLMTVVVAADVNAGPPVSDKQWKAGWSDTEITGYATACTDALVVGARLGYAAAAEKAGDHSPTPFPEAKFKESAGPLCACISRRAAQTWDFSEFSAKGDALAKPFFVEALGGGACKPEGMLGEAVGHVKM